MAKRLPAQPAFDELTDVQDPKVKLLIEKLLQYIEELKRELELEL